MSALGTALKTLTSLARKLCGPAGQAKARSSRCTPRTLSFRPSLEGLEDRLMPSTAPAAPVVTLNDIAGTQATGSQVNLSWNHVSNATGYLVDQWTGSAWKQIANLGSGATGYDVTGLKVSTTFYFDVAAYDSAGTTWANFQSIVTIDHPTGGTYSPVIVPLGANSPSYLNVQQGAVGDCWLLASLAEVADRQPSVIQNMFTYMGTELENGTTVGLYSVRLYNNWGSAFSVIVDTELPSGGGLYDHPTSSGMWVALAEKAYVEANAMGQVTTSSAAGLSLTSYQGTDCYLALNGGDPAWALHAITGQSASDYSINPSNIASAWNSGKLIVLCTGNNPASSDIVGDHCYALVGYNASSSQPFEVFNPWGTNSSGWVLDLNNNHEVYGLFNASAAFLSQNFATQSFGTGAENLSGNLGGTIGGQIQVPLNGFAGSVTNFAQTGGSLTTNGSLAGTLGNQVEGSTLLALPTQQVNLLAGNGFWAQAGDQHSQPDLLGQSWLLF